MQGKRLRERGINRIGNLLVPNDNYCLFEDWIMPKLDAMLAEQREKVRKVHENYKKNSWENLEF